jgi:hypothetical protein
MSHDEIRMVAKHGVDTGHGIAAKGQAVLVTAIQCLD